MSQTHRLDVRLARRQWMLDVHVARGELTRGQRCGGDESCPQPARLPATLPDGSCRRISYPQVRREASWRTAVYSYHVRQAGKNDHHSPAWLMQRQHGPVKHVRRRSKQDKCAEQDYLCTAVES